MSTNTTNLSLYHYRTKYNFKYLIDESSDNFYVRHNNEVYEYEVIYGKNRIDYKNSIVAYQYNVINANSNNSNSKENKDKENTVLFVLSLSNKLHVYVQGKKHRTFLSVEDIIDNDGVFLIRNNNKIYTVNKYMETAFITCGKDNVERIRYYTDKGVVFYMSNIEETKEEKEIEENNENKKKENTNKKEVAKNKKKESPCNCINCRHFIINLNTTTLTNTHLIMHTLTNTIMYNTNTPPLLSLSNGIFVFSSTSITDVVHIKHIEYGTITIYVVLSKNGVYILNSLNNIIILKQINTKYVEIDIDNMIVHNYISSMDISDAILMVGLYSSDIDICDHFNMNISKFLLFIIDNYTNDSIPHELFLSFITGINVSYVCEIYKIAINNSKVKDTIRNIILSNTYKLSAQDIYDVITHEEELEEIFLDRAVSEKKMYLVKDYYTYLCKNNREKRIERLLLEKGIVVDVRYLKIEDKKVEKEIEEMIEREIESSRKRNEIVG